MAKTSKKQMRNEIIIDMDEFIVTYAATLLDPNKNLSQLVYDTAKEDITKLDDLFKDNGFGRKNKFYNIGEGFLRDYDNLDAEEAQKQADQLATEAIDYLGKNVSFFERWRTD
ncbi:hypothetical protein YK48G_18230 [Lentilactobacillus fungorum]|jgi:hypothetical protein|uniref:Uncharacterized protein n=1 Tax=Lentilactobacillus fungorum TaxID=2201250 RepID=A0ABQ3W077_9LACO|nr:hypothetical protein [Lentilactobacillus fungorum]GHP14398.1 hypothetical protein YK48G_18230 [Lentilactobacillus fungorum]